MASTAFFSFFYVIIITTGWITSTLLSVPGFWVEMGIMGFSDTASVSRIYTHSLLTCDVEDIPKRHGGFLS